MIQQEAFDTSGAVEWPDGEILRWDRLSPFAQGYVEAALDACRYERASAGTNKGDHVLKWDERINCANSRRLAFRDLAPSTLAAMLRDCERFAALSECQTDERNGRIFWDGRQRGVHLSFPPLTLSLGDDGKVYAREAS